MSTVPVTVGHTVVCSYQFVDTAGNPMLVQPTPDAPATWSDTTPATGALAASGDGTTLSEAIIAAGTDTISMKVSVGGVSYGASVDIVASAAPQQLGGVVILTTVQ